MCAAMPGGLDTAAWAAGLSGESFVGETGLAVLGSPGAEAGGRREAPQYSYDIVRAFPHDAEAFTQGLLYYQGFLYESTGLNGRSSVRKVDLDSGKVLQKRDLPVFYFGEGLALLGGKLYQLTWLSQKGFVYVLDSFQPLRDFTYSGQGWGLTQDGQSLIMSDGSDRLRFLDPETFDVKRTLAVHDGLQPVPSLNELEYIKGEIYANIWTKDRIARIDPQSGQVKGWIDLSGLTPPQVRRNPNAVLNGIAYDPEHDRLFVTGKLWPQIFEIRLRPK
jgi:glutamine cyclotransferase